MAVLCAVSLAACSWHTSVPDSLSELARLPLNSAARPPPVEPEERARAHVFSQGPAGSELCEPHVASSHVMPVSTITRVTDESQVLVSYLLLQGRGVISSMLHCICGGLPEIGHPESEDTWRASDDSGLFNATPYTGNCLLAEKVTVLSL